MQEDKRGKLVKLGNKRGVSPVIATVILIAIVIVIGLTIFLWFRGFTGRTGEKFGENLESVCDRVAFDASYSGGNLFISNIGNIPIYSFVVTVESDGGHDSEDIRILSSAFPEVGLNQQDTFSDSVAADGNKIILIPILLGNSDGEELTHQCKESSGVEINIL